MWARVYVAAAASWAGALALDCSRSGYGVLAAHVTAGRYLAAFSTRGKLPGKKKQVPIFLPKTAYTIGTDASYCSQGRH